MKNRRENRQNGGGFSVKTLDFREREKTLAVKLEKNSKWGMIKGDITAGEGVRLPLMCEVKESL